MDITNTEWDDDRILARVEARQGPGELKLSEYVVRLYDCGPVATRLDDPKLVYESERTEGFSGVFQKSEKADRFAKRIKAAILHKMRLRELVQAERRANITTRLESKEAEIEEAEAEAKAAKAIAKAGKRAQKKLWREVDHPAIDVECRPAGKGYVLTLAPSETNGPSSIVLVSVGEDEEPAPLPVSLEEILAATERRAAESPPESKPAKLPPAVVGSSGPRLKPGMRIWVEQPDAEPWVGELLKILRQDAAGAFWIEVANADGEPREVNAAHCRKAKKGEG